MKVLNVNISLDPMTGGGTAERTFQMSRFLAKAGIECALLTTDISLTAERIEDLEAVKVIVLNTLNNRFYIPKFSYNMVRNIVKDVDIIHLMNHWTFLNALVYFIARRLQKPYVVCPAGSLQIYHRSKLIKGLYNWVVGKKIIRNANGYIAVTSGEIPQFQAYGVDKDKISVIPNGINREDFILRGKSDFKRKYDLIGLPFILFVGRLHHIKGPDLLLRAFCNIKDKLRDFHLVFVGPDGGMLAELEDMVTKCGAGDRVHFLGYLGGADKSQAYHAADLLVIPSRREAMSIVVLEAGITGTPILLTDQCGFDEVAAIGGGKIVPASVDGLQEGLIELISDPAQLKLKGENLKRYICENFSWDSVVNKYVELYRQILELE
jgi:glycosyltransferase involved in cell wall biosynthesis